MNQLLLVHRGITDWKQLISMLNANYYELNENYRNTVEITEFCNSKFNYKHTPIGIRGPGVEKITTNQILDAIKLEKGNDHKTRTAVISNDSYSELFELIKRAYPSDDSILIGNVKEVKGLEFDVVFVIVNKMSKSELYISYTRALNHLYIVES